MPEVRSAALAFWVGVGSRDESAREHGSSHFLEHVVFKGTSTRSALDIAAAFDAMGGEANAFSTKEYTCFHARVLAEDVPETLDILKEIVFSPSISIEDVEQERQVILEEIAAYSDSPEDLVHDIFAEMIYGDHPLGREVVGTAKTVRALSEKGLRKFHERNYRSGRVVFSSAGAVDEEQIRSMLDGHVSDKALRDVEANVPGKVVERLRVQTRPTEQAHLVLGGMGFAHADPRRFAWGLLDVISGGGLSSRLFQEVRERRGLVYSIYSYRNTFRDSGFWAVSAGCSPQRIKEVLELTVAELDKLRRDGVTEAELSRAKRHTIGSLTIAYEDPQWRMNRIGRSALFDERVLDLDEIRERVEGVTLEDVRAVASELFDPANRSLAVIGPFSVDDMALFVDRR